MIAARDADQIALQQWQNTMQQMCGQFRTYLPERGHDFVGQIQCNNHSPLTLASLRTNAGRIVRNGTNAEREDVDHCFLVMNDSGFTRVSHEGLQLELGPGDIFLMNGIHQCEIVPHGLIEHTSVPLPRHRAEQILGHHTPLFGKVATDSATGLLIRSMLDQLRQCQSDVGSHLQTDAISDALLALIKPALLAGSSNLQSSSSFGRNTWQAACYLINRHLQQGLTPEQLASQLNISVRQLHRVFEEQQDSVCRYIQRARLQRSAEDLRNPQLQHEAVTTIGYKWGFSDAAHFSRSFKKHYGISPRQYRNGDC